MILQNCTWEEIASLDSSNPSVAVIPVGSVEQHGRHLPLGTDSFVAQAIAEEASELTETIVTPPVWYGWSPHHLVLAGTITIRPEILIEYVYDIIASLKKHGITKVVLLNGHRLVNIAWMQIAAEKAQRNLGMKVVIFDPAYMSKSLAQKFGSIGHADEIETSHMLHIHPELVYLEKAKDNPVIDQPLYSADPRYPEDTLCYVPGTTSDMMKAVTVAGGTIGEPTHSSAAKGEIYHQHLVKNLVKIIENLKQRE